MLQRDERCTVLLREFPLEAAWCAVLWTLAAESEEDSAPGFGVRL
jgi:hypothetical protein